MGLKDQILNSRPVVAGQREAGKGLRERLGPKASSVTLILQAYVNLILFYHLWLILNILHADQEVREMSNSCIVLSIVTLIGVH